MKIKKSELIKIVAVELEKVLSTETYNVEKKLKKLLNKAHNITKKELIYTFKEFKTDLSIFNNISYLSDFEFNDEKFYINIESDFGYFKKDVDIKLSIFPNRLLSLKLDKLYRRDIDTFNKIKIHIIKIIKEYLNYRIVPNFLNIKSITNDKYIFNTVISIKNSFYYDKISDNKIYIFNNEKDRDECLQLAFKLYKY